VTPQIALLGLMVFALIATRPFEERRWRAGRLTDRGSALLLVARLPLFAAGWCLAVGIPPLGVLGALLVGGAAGALLLPPVERRLARVRTGGR
jgi:hypothetical protein